jgi:hypothetical protein
LKNTIPRNNRKKWTDFRYYNCKRKA